MLIFIEPASEEVGFFVVTNLGRWRPREMEAEGEGEDEHGGTGGAAEEEAGWGRTRTGGGGAACADPARPEGRNSGGVIGACGAATPRARRHQSRRR